MYIIVEHTISDPSNFFPRAEQTLTSLPPKVKLHHTFNAPDGVKAVCVWEADSIAAVKDYLEPIIGRFSHNEYFEVLNKEGIVLPTLKVTA